MTPRTKPYLSGIRVYAQRELLKYLKCTEGRIIDKNN